MWLHTRVGLLYLPPPGYGKFKKNSPIALTSVVGKLLHKIISRRLETYLNFLDTSTQKGFVSGMSEHIYQLLCKMPLLMENH